MVNSVDFRRYSFSSDASYAVDAFSRTRTNAAPDIKREHKRTPKKELRVNRQTRTKEIGQLIAEEKAVYKDAAIILATALLTLCVIFAMMFTYAQKNELTNEISAMNKSITLAESENVSLNAKLESMVSVSQIDNYAVEKLGMIKIEANQIRYIDSEKTKDAQQAASIDDVQ